MKKGMKKAIASMLAVTMVLGSSIMSFAGAATPASNPSSSSNETTASGNFEGHVDKSVFSVTLPTVSADNYNFIIDPEALISATNGKRYGDNAIFDPAATSGVYFANSVANDGKVTYKNESAKMDVINRSSVSVNVTMAIEITDLNDNIKVVSQNSDVNVGTDANLWLAVTDGTNEVSVNGTTASLTTLIDGKPDNYTVSWNAAADKYLYVIADGTPDNTWETASLGLKGACNTSASANWSAAGLSEESTVKVTWSYEGVGATVEAGIFYDSKTNDWWIGVSEDEGFATGITLGDVTVNGDPINATVKAYGGTDWVLVKWSDYKTAGYDTSERSFDFTAVINGTTYTAHYEY